MLQKTLWNVQVALQDASAAASQKCEAICCFHLWRALLWLRSRGCALQRQWSLLWPLKCVKCGQQTLKSTYRCFSGKSTSKKYIRVCVCALEIWCNFFHPNPKLLTWYARWNVSKNQLDSFHVSFMPAVTFQADLIDFSLPVEPLSRSCGLPTGPRMTLDTRHCPLVSCNAPSGFTKVFFQSGSREKRMIALPIFVRLLPSPMKPLRLQNHV